MTEINIRNDIKVELVQHVGSDEMVAKAARVSTGNDLVENDKIKGLIRYLVKNNHVSPLEHTLATFRIEAPIFVAREAMRHRTFCVSGDTLVTFGSESNGKISMTKKTISEHWEHWHVGVSSNDGRKPRKLKSVRDSRVVSVDESTGELHLQGVVDVVKSGVKPVYKLTTERGFSVTATRDHRVLTPEGWVELGDLDSTHSVMTQHKSWNKESRRTVPMGLRQAINSWSRGFVGELVTGQGGLCGICGKSPDKFVVDHKVPVALDLTKALDRENLHAICPTCDRSKTSSEQKLANRVGEYDKISPDRVVSVVYVGEEMTYDLSVESPHHNFLGNGVVVHNCYNELSGRYAKLKPDFYIPATERPLVNAGSGAHPKLTHPGTPEDVRDLQYSVGGYSHRSYEISWKSYEAQLDEGIATEVARNVLPVATYTAWYQTGNLHAWLNFLNLRIHNENATYPSYPQWEIEQMALQIKAELVKLFPITMAAWEERQSNPA